MREMKLDTGMVRIAFQPSGCRIATASGTTVLACAQKAGLGLNADCGGMGSCGRCRIQVQPNAPVSPPSESEFELMGAGELSAGFRLACQTRVFGSTSVYLPADSVSTTQRLQVEGQGTVIDLDLPTTLCELSVPGVTSELPRPDWERLAEEVKESGFAEPGPPRLPILQSLNDLLRIDAGRVTVGLRNDGISWVLARNRPVLGLAVDVGTTKIAGYLVDLRSGKTLASAAKMNSQIALGEDVMTRIACTIEREDGLAILHECVLETINDLAVDLCKETSKAGDITGTPEPGCIVECVMVGNTVMHHFLLNLPVAQLGMAPFVPVVSRDLDFKADRIGLHLNENANVHLPPNVAGFVGSDHVSVLLASGVSTSSETVLVLDVGTNTEISLITRNGITTCSAASGPAFEGAHIQCGMRAAEGAIERIRIRGRSIECTTVGGCAPTGICGSGILDAVAQFRLHNVIDRHGGLNADSPFVRRGVYGPEILLVPAARTGHGRDIVVGRKDIGKVQLAKGAIRSGIHILLDAARVSPDEIEKILIGGAFGMYLDIDNAMSIGMLPRLPADRFRQIGNAAGAGAVRLLLSRSLRKDAASLAGRIRHLELAGTSGFRSTFINALRLET